MCVFNLLLVVVLLLLLLVLVIVRVLLLVVAVVIGIVIVLLLRRSITIIRNLTNIMDHVLMSLLPIMRSFFFVLFVSSY